MPYISELLNNQVNDSSDSTVGKLKDVLIKQKNGNFPPLEFLVVQMQDKQIKFVPYEYVANFTSSKISLKNLFSSIALSVLPPGQRIYLKRDVLDQQIVDVGGTRVVRVNDLRIGNFENKMCVLGIDPSFRGLLRRLGLEGIFLARLFKVHLIDWRQAQMLSDKGTLQLNTMAENLSQLHPADLANIVEELDIKQGSRFLASLNARKAAKVMEELDPRLQNILVKYLGPETAGNILTQMSSDEITNLVKSFTTEEAQSFLSKIEALKAKNIEKLIEYPDNTAGGFMTLDFVIAHPSWTAQQTIEEIKKLSATFRSIVFVYVTAEDGTFKGVVSLRRLLIADSLTKISKLTKAVSLVSTLRPNDKIRKIIRVMTKYNLYAAAVIDLKGKLVGVVTIDDVMRHLFPNA